MAPAPRTPALLAALALVAGGATAFVAVGPPAGSAPQTAPAAADPALAERLDELLADPAYDGSQVGLVVRDAATEEVLYDREGSDRLLPASNAKLFTSTAALAGLGRGFRFHTDVLTNGERVGPGDSVLDGDLFLRGGGDPTALARDYRGLATDLADAGITTVHGNLFTDATYFDAAPLGTGWSWDDEPYYYSAVVSALTVAPNTDYDAGNVIVTAGPGARAGDPVEVSMTPRTDVLEVVDRSTTGPAGSTDTLSIDRQHATNRVIISGNVPVDGGETINWVTVPDPPAYAADVFRRALTAAGVSVEGPTRRATTPPDADRLATDRSMNLARLMTPFLKLSNNGHAETLVKTLGAELGGQGSWDAGLEQVLAYADDVGVDVSRIRLVDGSGLSRMDELTPDAIADLLLAAQDEPWFDTWYDALPIAGEPDRMVGGTLRSRMVGTAAAGNLHAKTGSLTGVTALSGYVTDADGRLLVFSMLSNHYLTSPRAIEDAVGVTLAEWSDDADSRGEPVDPAELQPAHPLPVGVECSWVRAC